jgi:hypothetical protein
MGASSKQSVWPLLVRYVLVVTVCLAASFTQSLSSEKLSTEILATQFLTLLLIHLLSYAEQLQALRLLDICQESETASLIVASGLWLEAVIKEWTSVFLVAHQTSPIPCFLLLAIYKTLSPKPPTSKRTQLQIKNPQKVQKTKIKILRLFLSTQRFLHSVFAHLTPYTPCLISIYRK